MAGLNYCAHVCENQAQCQPLALTEEAGWQTTGTLELLLNLPKSHVLLTTDLKVKAVDCDDADGTGNVYCYLASALLEHLTSFVVCTLVGVADPEPADSVDSRTPLLYTAPGCHGYPDGLSASEHEDVYGADGWGLT